MIHVYKSKTPYKILSLVTLLSWLMTSQAFAQCQMPNVLTIPDDHLTSALVGNGNFNALVLGNYTSTGADTEGRLAVGGNFSVTSGYGIGMAGAGVSAPQQTDNFIVNGTFSNTSGIAWQVRGNFIYSANASGSTLPSHAANEGANTVDGPESRIKFSGLKEYYTSVSQSISSMPKSATCSVTSWNALMLIGDNTLRDYVFTLSLPSDKLAEVHFINIPEGSKLTINILNTNVTIANGSFMSSKYRAQTLFNFPYATHINFGNLLFEGSVLAPQASLTGSGGGINGQSVIGGDVSQTNGFEFHNFCLEQSPTPMPVKLSSFSVVKDERASRLNWTTASEDNNQGFAIEHSLDAKSWKPLAFVAGLGTSREGETYTYRDEQPGPGTNYYRLGQVDNTGQTTYSRIQAVTFPEESITVYPNPAVDKVYLRLPESNTYAYHVALFDELGRQTSIQSQTLASGALELDVQQVLEGVYMLQVIREGNVMVKKLLIKH